MRWPWQPRGYTGGGPAYKVHNGEYYVPDAAAAEALRKQLQPDDTTEIWFRSSTGEWARWW